jgi:hypothetical protein
MELLVNETPQTAAATRTLFYGKCPKVDGRPGAYMVFPTQYGLAECVRFDFDLKKGSFILEIGWMRIATHFAVWMKMQLCVNLQTLFGIGPPLFAEICVGGKIEFHTKSVCPQVTGFSMTGSAWFTFEIGLDFWICRIVFANITLAFEAGLGWATVAVRCWWVQNEGYGRRRYCHRRRTWRPCNTRNDCDIYVKGYFEITYFIIRARLEFIYWVKNKEMQILLTMWAWAFKWWEAFSICIYRRQFR